MIRFRFLFCKWFHKLQSGRGYGYGNTGPGRHWSFVESNWTCLICGRTYVRKSWFLERFRYWSKWVMSRIDLKQMTGSTGIQG